MNNLKVLGSRFINGKEIKNISGGFGDGRKCLLALDIAKQHNTETKHINELIKKNMLRFTTNDLIDLCDEDFKVVANDLGLITSNGQKHCFLLSERGYTKLVATMSNNNDKKWEVMDILINEYFTMKEIIQTNNFDVTQMINDMMPSIVQNTIQSTMMAMTTILEKNNQMIFDRLEHAERSFIDASNIITEQEIKHAQEIKETKDLIGFKTKNTASLTKLLKAKLSNIKGYKVMAEDYHYIMAKERLFKKYLVWNWEEIPVNRYNEVHADIDSIEDLEDIYFN